MLQLVRDRQADWDWPQAPRGGDRRPRLDDYEKDFLPPRRRPKRRSVAGRVALRLLLAVALLGAGAALYVSARDGTLQAALGRLEGPSRPAAEQDTAAAQLTAAETGALQQQSAAQGGTAPPMPDVPGLVILIRNAVVALHQANVSGNYAVLRAIGAPGLQQANSPASLSEAFSDLRGRGIDLAHIAAVNPSLKSPPTITEQGLLTLSGFFPVGDEQVGFDLAFQMVNERWRLFGIGVYPPTQPTGEKAATKEPTPTTDKPSLPDAATMVALIRGAVIALNQANMVGDYSVLRDIAAPGFQEANDVAKLSAAFADLRARRLDLAPVAIIDPQLFRQPAIDQNGYLRLTGFFPSRPEQVNFDLAFQRVDGDWQLFGIGLNTSRQVPVESSAAPVSVGAGEPRDGAQAGAGANEGRTLPPPPPRPRPQGQPVTQ